MSTHTHPQDPRVIIASSVPDFIGATQHRGIQAVILKRSAELKQSIKTRLRACWQSAQRANPVSSDVFIACKPRLDNRMMLDSPQGFDDKTITQETQDMADTYQAIGTYGETNILMYSRFHLPTHDHEFDVLNCSWSGLGTGWHNETNEELRVEEGNWFFFRAGFEHHSPDLAPDMRFVFIVRPIPPVQQSCPLPVYDPNAQN